MMDIIKSSYLPKKKSAQQAELIALTGTYQLARDQLTNIYTESSHAFGVAHNFRILLSTKASNFLRAAHKKWKMGCKFIRCHREIKTTSNYQNSGTF